MISTLLPIAFTLAATAGPRTDARQDTARRPQGGCLTADAFQIDSTGKGTMSIKNSCWRPMTVKGCYVLVSSSGEEIPFAIYVSVNRLPVRRTVKFAAQRLRFVGAGSRSVWTAQQIRAAARGTFEYHYGPNTFAASYPGACFFSDEI